MLLVFRPRAQPGPVKGARLGHGPAQLEPGLDNPSSGPACPLIGLVFTLDNPCYYYRIKQWPLESYITILIVIATCISYFIE